MVADGAAEALLEEASADLAEALQVEEVPVEAGETDDLKCLNETR